MKSLCALLAAALVLMLAGAALAQGGAGTTKITALRMDFANTENRAVFGGDVYVLTGGLEIWSDRMVVEFVGEGSLAGEGAQPEIDTVVATGNVRLRKGRFKGTCGRATWDASSQIIILTDAPVLTEGENVLKGEVVTLYLAEDRSEVQGSADRPVEMLFSTPGGPTEAATPSGDAKP